MILTPKETVRKFLHTGRQNKSHKGHVSFHRTYTQMIAVMAPTRHITSTSGLPFGDGHLCFVSFLLIKNKGKGIHTGLGSADFVLSDRLVKVAAGVSCNAVTGKHSVPQQSKSVAGSAFSSVTGVAVDLFPSGCQ